MITGIHIENFESHRNTSINFVSGLNVIIGKTDSGKSSIRRAINWVCKNRPTGDTFISWWGGPCSVQITLDDGNTITRVKDGNKNIYRINDKEFTAFGTDVPKEVSELLNFSEVNLQSQFDSPFLLNSTPGEVAQHFNKIAKIDDIDRAIKNVNSWQKVIEKNIDIKKGLVQEYTSKLTNFENLDTVEAEYEVLEGMQKNITEYSSKITKIVQITNELTHINEELVEKENQVIVEPYINSLLKVYDEKDNAENELKKLKKIVQDMYYIKVEIKQKSHLISCETTIENLIQLYAQKEGLEKNKKDTGTLITTIKATMNLINSEVGKIEKLEERFRKDFPDTCPLCGSITKKAGKPFNFKDGILNKAMNAKDDLTKLI